MNRSRMTPQPEQGAGYTGYPAIPNQGGGGAGSDQSTPGGYMMLMGLPRTQLVTLTYPFPPTNPYYPLLGV